MEEAREAALSRLDGLENMDIAFSLLDRLARIAGGRHSSFTPPELAQESLSAARNDADFPLPSVEVIEGDDGLVRLPGFSATTPSHGGIIAGFWLILTTEKLRRHSH